MDGADPARDRGRLRQKARVVTAGPQREPMGHAGDGKQMRGQEEALVHARNNNKPVQRPCYIS